ncbi:MAG: FtsX-like permease family protein [Candidatus Ratteibacteria bacterium]
MKRIRWSFFLLFVLFPVSLFAQSSLPLHLSFFSSLPTRLPGTPSCNQAADYIVQQFRSAGLRDITIDHYTTVVPIDKGSFLDIGAKIPIHPFWPNSARTCTTIPEGIVGPIHYCPGSTIKSLTGKDIKGSIVILDFNSQNLWLDIAMLGAKAFLFIEPETGNRAQGEKKFASVPLDVPRFYVQKEYVGQVLGAAASGKNARVVGRVDWTKAPSRNIYGFVEGKDAKLKEEIIIIESFYDSISVVPMLAPGAEAASGISSLLALAEHFAKNPPQRSVLFLAASAHYHGLNGIDNFIQTHLRKQEPFRSRIKKFIEPKFVFCLDLSTQSNQVAIWHNSTDFFLQRVFNPVVRNLLEHGKNQCKKRGISPERYLINGVTPEKGVTWRNFLTEPLRTDGERLINCGIPSLSFVTVNDARTRIDTPFDRFSSLNIANLERQHDLISTMIAGALNEKDFFINTDLKSVKDRSATLTTKVVTFNPKKSFVPSEPVPNALVIPRFILIDPLNPYSTFEKTFLGVRNDLLEMTDEKGQARGSRFPTAQIAFLQAYAFDPNTGAITLSPDFGVNGDEQFPMLCKIDYKDKKWLTVLFQSTPINLFGLVDPQYLFNVDRIDVFDLSNSLPDAYGFFFEHPTFSGFRWSSDSDPSAVVFAKPGSHVKIAGESGPLGIRILLLNSKATKTNKHHAEGLGFDADSHEAIYALPYQAAYDMIQLDAYRSYNFERYNIRNERLGELQKQSTSLLALADNAAEQKNWWNFLKFSRQAQAIESRAYPDVKSTANDVVKGIIFYFLLLLPFAYFSERLFFGFAKIEKRIVAVFAIFVLIYFIMRGVHPAFKLTDAPEVILLAFIILSLSLVVISIITSKFEEQMQKMKREGGKVYQTDVGRASAAGTAFSLGVANMKRRKTRTMLTGTTLVLLTFTVLSFTSIKSYMRFNQILRNNKPTYQGILLRDRSWNPLQEVARDYVNGDFEGTGTIAPRYWYINPQLGEKTAIEIFHGNNSYLCSGIVGLTEQEKDITEIHKTLRAGNWISAEDHNVAIISDKIAKSLGIGSQDIGTARITVYGKELTIKAIYDSTALEQLKDLDNEPLMPVDFSSMPEKEIAKIKMEKTAMVSGGSDKIESFIHLEASNIIIVPIPLVQEFKGTLQSIAVRFFPNQDIKTLVENFVSKLAVILFVGIDNKSFVYSSIGLTSLSGLSNLIIPILIAALIVLNTMLGSVYERLREIGTYSAVGLAPVHISALFLAESGVFAVLGSVLGYLLGQVLTKILIVSGLLKGLILNYSSLSAVFATLIIMITVLLSTLYPARKASQMAVPDVTRKWVLPDPKGDQWFFEFPFTVSELEVLGLATFLTEYFSSYQDVSLGNFYTNGATLSVGNHSDDKKVFSVKTAIWLAPFDLGVSQNLNVHFEPLGQYNFYTITLDIERIGGEAADWKRLNRRFLDGIRKQFLVWRTISPEIKKEYEVQGKGELVTT